MTNADDQPKRSLSEAVRRLIEIGDEVQGAHPHPERKPLPGERLYFDLRKTEQTSDADLMIRVTEESERPGGIDYPPGIIVEANRGAHGADVHLRWEQTKLLRDVLTRILREAGQE